MAVVAYLRVSTENSFGKPAGGDYTLRRKERDEH